MSIVSFLNQPRFEVKLKAGGFYCKVDVIVKGSKLQLHFPYNADLLKEVKENFEGRQYLGFKEGEPKCWQVPITHRNVFRFDVLMGKYSERQPYEQFELIEKEDLSQAIRQFCAQRHFPVKLYDHQVAMINQALLGRWFIWGAEMGTGKTLAAIIAMEMMKKKYGLKETFWIGPRSALAAVRVDFDKWACTIRPEFYTYEGLRDLAGKWIPGRPAPQMIFFDEASKLKNPAAQRTQSAKYVADKIREEYGYECLVGLLSGSPAPKSPADWWSLCEVACPGYIREGHINVFRQRLAIIEKRETVPGAGSYDHIVAWRDRDTICTYCGQPPEHVNHAKTGMDRFMSNLGEGQKGQTFETHEYKATENEVAKLKTRMRGLVGVWLKEDCLDLPPKRYEIIRVKPSRATLNAAKIIAQTSGRAIEALTLQRELSDGFQYQDLPTGNYIECPTCKGRGEITEYNNPANPAESFSAEEIEKGVRFLWSEPQDEFSSPEIIGEEPIQIIEEVVTCFKCKGEKKVPEMRRETVEVECPKDQVLIDLLERHEEIGRFNVYGGFTGSIDRIVRICHQQGWATVRVDGRGWKGEEATGVGIPGKSDDLLRIYMTGQEQYPKVVFVGQGGAAGMGLTLTASPTTFIFSNTFNFEDRDQLEARGHRIGMDLERGGVIIDCFHLPSDELVHTNLKKKKDLQYLSMKGIQNILFQETEA